MKLKELILKKECPLKATIKYGLNMSGESKLTGRQEKFLDIFKSDDVSDLYKLDEIRRNQISEIFQESLFDSDKEREAYIRASSLKIERFCMNMAKYQNKNISTNKGANIKIGKYDVYAHADIVFEDNNEAILLNLVDSEAKIKNGGKTEATQSKKSIELFGLYKLGRKLYPGKVVTSGLVYLKERSNLNYMPNRTSMDKKEEAYFEEIIENLSNKDKYEECEECSKFCEYYPICSYTHSLEEYKALEVEESLIKERELPVINFSDEQKRVINFKRGCGVVNAVAGAGKTTVLSKRVERLMNLDGCSPEDIVIISFSEKTIDEFKEKLSEKFGVDEFNNVYTFNGFGDKLLKEEYSLFGYSKPPRLMDEIIKYDIVKEIIDSTEIITELEEINNVWSNPSGMIVKRLNYDMMFPSGGFGIPLIFQISRIFDDIKKKGLSYSSEEFIEDKFSEFAQEVIQQKSLSGAERSYILNLYKKFLSKIYSRKNSMYGRYVYMLKDRGYYDYLDQINYLVASFGNPRLKNKFKYKHIICDEFQDSNSSAMMVLKKLTMNEKFESLLVVGDINQSIYGFQGATPENLMSFDKYFMDTVEVFDISYSYRVPQIVAKKANALMERAYGIKYNKMNAFKDLEGVSARIKDKDELLNTINGYIAKDKTIGIIARNNDDLNDYIDLLVKNDIPYAVKSNLYIMKKPKVVNLNGLHKALINPEKNRMEFLKYLMVADNDNFVTKFKTSEFEVYYNEKYIEFLKAIETKNSVELLDIYYLMLEPLAKKDYMIETYLNNVKRRYPKNIEDVSKYCFKLEMYMPTIKVPENNLETNVILTTGHSSKGREFDVVIMDIATFSASGEEDRRLFYVSMTRAKEALYFINLRRRISVSKKKSCQQYMDIIDRAW